MKKFVKICLLSLVLVFTFGAIFSASFLGVKYLQYQQLPLNEQSLTNSSLSIEVYDNQNKKIKEDNQFNGDFCPLSKLNQYTIDAFVSIEDKEFYNHNGINIKRMAKALINNIKSGKIKEGASTISQQLIKNTHLNSEKTFERKLKEIALTKKLEKRFNKDQIMESYLNIIFFGNNCYGIESASNYYFGKDAKDLNLNESATLAGMIKSATKYSPIKNYENCIARRNLVLNEMEKDGKISVDEKIITQNEPIVLNITQKNHNKINSYSQASIDEASNILGISPKQIALGGYKIHTYQNEEKQKALCNALTLNKIDQLDNAGIVIDAKTNGVSAYYANSNFKMKDIKRQPASTLKPILVYAPALNENMISPDTQILDEEIKIGDYKPTNVNKKFAGYVSITEAVKDSINIPAIKVLSYISIDTGKEYAEKLGIHFDKKDDSFALALGGMTQGVSLEQLTSAYTVFPNNGKWAPSSFVQYITDKNNRLVYIHKNNPTMILREDSAYLMTNILQETAKNGTARKLSTIKDFEVASKTGTAGNKKGNTDAYNISYTPEEVIGVWFGDLSNKPVSIAGGNQPTEVVREYLNSQSYKKTSFDIPFSVTEVEIDSLEKEENHRLVLASPYAPTRYKQKCLVSRFNMPSEVSQNFCENPKIEAEAKTENKQIVIILDAKKYLEYQIYKDGILLQKIADKGEKLTIRIAFIENEAEIKIIARYQNCEQLESEKIFNLTQKQTANTKPKDKWYI